MAIRSSYVRQYGQLGFLLTDPPVLRTGGR